MLRDAARLTCSGCVAGLILPFFVTKPLALFLIAELKPGDPLNFAAVSLIMLLTGLAAAWGHLCGERSPSTLTWLYEKNSVSTSPAHIRPFQHGDARAFRDLNEEWIGKYFSLEEQDRITLGNPEVKILEPGGHIFMAVDEDEHKAVGCCALIPVGSGVLELGKMAVAPEYRGRGIGRALLEYAIAKARDMGASSVHLASNTRLPDAIHLYESVGFRHVPAEQLPPSQYVRSNVFMDLHF